MKLIVAIVLTALLSFVSGFWLPWWGIAIAALLVALLLPLRSGGAFIAGFLGVFILWIIIAWWKDMKNEGILSQRIAEVLPLGGSSFLLVLVTAVVGGIVGGFAALTGSFIRKP